MSQNKNFRVCRLISTYPIFYAIQMPFLTPILTPIVMIYNGSKWCKMI